MNADDKREEVLKTIDDMSNDKFWQWVRGWLDAEIPMDMIKNWDEEVMAEVYDEFIAKGLIKENK